MTLALISLQKEEIGQLPEAYVEKHLHRDVLQNSFGVQGLWVFHCLFFFFQSCVFAIRRSGIGLWLFEVQKAEAVRRDTGHATPRFENVCSRIHQINCQY